MADTLLLATTGTTILNFVIFIVGFASPGWMYFKGFPPILRSAWSGLWQICSTSPSGAWECFQITSDMTNDSEKATQAMMVLALLANVAALGAIVSRLANFNLLFSNRILTVIHAGLSAVAALFCLIAISVYGAYEDTLIDVYELHYAFGLTVVSMIFAGVAAGLSIMLMNRTD